MSSLPPSLVTRLRREKTRPKTSFWSSEAVRGLRAGGSEGVDVMLLEEVGRAVMGLPEEVGRGWRKRRE